MTILTNATILSNFAAVERLDLLHLLWEKVYMAYAVHEELQAGSAEGYKFLAELEGRIYPFRPDGWIYLVELEGEEEFALYEATPARLHRGESMSLAIAQSRGWQFLTDDRNARRYARQIGVPVGGTIGTLVELVERGHLGLDEANLLLSQMINKARYHSPVVDLSGLVAGAQERKQTGREDE